MSLSLAPSSVETDGVDRLVLVGIRLGNQSFHLLGANAQKVVLAEGVEHPIGSGTTPTPRSFSQPLPDPPVLMQREPRSPFSCSQYRIKASNPERDVPRVLLGTVECSAENASALTRASPSVRYPCGRPLFRQAGRKRTLAGEDLSRLRLGYAQHIYRAQGATVTKTLVVTGGWQASRQNAILGLARAVHRIVQQPEHTQERTR
jgi:hypothetical protein